MKYKIRNISNFSFLWYDGNLFKYLFLNSNVNNIKKFKQFLRKIKLFGITHEDLLKHKDAIQIPNIEYIVSTYLDSKEEELDEILELMFPFDQRDVFDVHLVENLKTLFPKRENFAKLTAFLDKKKQSITLGL